MASVTAKQVGTTETLALETSFSGGNGGSGSGSGLDADADAAAAAREPGDEYVELVTTIRGLVPVESSGSGSGSGFFGARARRWVDGLRSGLRSPRTPQHQLDRVRSHPQPTSAHSEQSIGTSKYASALGWFAALIGYDGADSGPASAAEPAAPTSTSLKQDSVCQVCSGRIVADGKCELLLTGVEDHAVIQAYTTGDCSGCLGAAEALCRSMPGDAAGADSPERYPAADELGSDDGPPDCVQDELAAFLLAAGGRMPSCEQLSAFDSTESVERARRLT